MNMRELEKLRRIGARPADPVHITDCFEVHEWCVSQDIVCMYMNDLSTEQDYSPLYNLDVVVIGRDGIPNMDAIRKVKPRALWLTGFYGWDDMRRESCK